MSRNGPTGDASRVGADRLAAGPLWQEVPDLAGPDLGVLGLGLRVRTNSARLEAAARAVFGRFARPGPSAPTFVLELVEGERAGPAVGGAMHRERGPLFVAGDGRASVVVADLDGGRSAAFVAADADSETVAEVIVASPVWRWAAYQGLVALHAAAVAVDGRALVLRAAAGGGKSTMAYAAALAGLTVVAEEVTWFDPTGPRALVRGAPWNIRLEPDATALFPSLAGRAADPWSGGAPKLVVDVEAEGGRTAEAAEPGGLVFLTREPGAEPWTRLGAAEAASCFAATAPVGEGTQRPERLAAAFEALVARGVYRLHVGDPAAAVASLAAIAADGFRP